MFSSWESLQLSLRHNRGLANGLRSRQPLLMMSCMWNCNCISALYSALLWLVYCYHAQTLKLRVSCMSAGLHTTVPCACGVYVCDSIVAKLPSADNNLSQLNFCFSAINQPWWQMPVDETILNKTLWTKLWQLCFQTHSLSCSDLRASPPLLTHCSEQLAINCVDYNWGLTVFY